MTSRYLNGLSTDEISDCLDDADEEIRLARTTIADLSRQLDECQLRGAALVADRDHWRNARSIAMEAGETLHDLVSAQNERIASLESRREEIERETAERIAAWLDDAPAASEDRVYAAVIRTGAWRSK